MKKLGLLFLIFILSACTATYDVVRVKHDNKQLSRNDSYYISTPENGKYENKYYSNSGEMVRDVLFNELIRIDVEAGKDSETLGMEESLVNANHQGFDVLIYPTINHWEDRATEWNGLRDRVKIKLMLIDVLTETTIESTTFDLVGTWWTFGGLHPEDIVEEAVGEYFQETFNLDD